MPPARPRRAREPQPGLSQSRLGAPTVCGSQASRPRTPDASQQSSSTCQTGPGRCPETSARSASFRVSERVPALQHSAPRRSSPSQPFLWSVCVIPCPPPGEKLRHERKERRSRHRSAARCPPKRCSAPRRRFPLSLRRQEGAGAAPARESKAQGAGLGTHLHSAAAPPAPAAGEQIPAAAKGCREGRGERRAKPVTLRAASLGGAHNGLHNSPASTGAAESPGAALQLSARSCGEPPAPQRPAVSANSSPDREARQFRRQTPPFSLPHVSKQGSSFCLD